MSLRADENWWRWRGSPVVFIVGFIAVLLLVFTMNKMTEFSGNAKHLRLGENNLVLEPGTYVLWWQAPYHTGHTGPEDFAFELSGDDGRSVPVREPLFGAALEGEREDLGISKLAKFTIKGDGGSFVLKARLLADVPKGELLLIGECSPPNPLNAFKC